ncbi:DUF6441 family protein [Ralstonia pseudosolanacearum]|uniref:DUF6441 family protein n=1 Tax=Ralstonia pseudosolanacearum TaxID=1310165 RepID=UPI00399D737C
MSQRISSLVALDGADEGLKRAIASAERSLGELAASAKTTCDRTTAGLAQVKVGVSVISEQITTARTQLLAFLSINWAAGKVQEIVQVADAYFVKNDRGNVVLMAENIGEHDRPLAGFKRRYRKAEGVKRIKRGADIPIAVLVRRVVLRKRLDIDQLVARRIPRLAAAIEARIRQLG